MSAQDLAKAAGVATSLVYETLHGARGISVDSLGRLANALDCDIAEFFRQQD